MLNNCNAVIVRTTRRIIAAALPQKIAVFCCFGYKLRGAKAITTALSPDNKIFSTIMDPNAIQNEMSENAAIDPILST
jgi:hypothetical protein